MALGALEDKEVLLLWLWLKPSFSPLPLTSHHQWSLSQWRLHWVCRGLSFMLDLSDQQYTLVFCMIFCFVVYLCLEMFVWYFFLRCHVCLLRAFPTIIVCAIKTTNMHVPISKYGGSNHGSPVFIRFGYLMVNSPTHGPKSPGHFLLTKKDRPCRLDQCNVDYITSWEV